MVIWFYVYMVIWLYSYVLISDYLFIRLFSYVVIWLFGYTVIWLYDNKIIWLCGYLVILLLRLHVDYMDKWLLSYMVICSYRKMPAHTINLTRCRVHMWEAKLAWSDYSLLEKRRFLAINKNVFRSVV